MSNIFRTVAVALRGHISDTYALIAAADAVVGVVEAEATARAAESRPTIESPDGHATYNWTIGMWDYSHDYVVGVAKSNGEVLRWLRDGRKINAIKVLRQTVPSLRLIQAKNAVEDDSVTTAAALYSDPWSPAF